MTERFWERLTLERMDPEQWEALCDGCGKCCLQKLEDAATGTIHYTNVACRLLDPMGCRCSDYRNRSRRVPGCVTLTSGDLDALRWLPSTCAYRLLAEGRPLFAWHPLLSNDPHSAIRSGNAVCGKVISELEADDLELHLIDWVE